MGKDTKIQWCHSTFNAWRGCTKVSPGCTNCYAETMSKRNPNVLGVWGDHGTRVVASEAKWKEPLKWDREAKEAGERRRVFCASLSDVFENWCGPMLDAKGDVIEGITMNLIRTLLWSTILRTPDLDWLLLTKRPKQAAEWVQSHPPVANAWLGVSVEDRKHGLPRIDILREIPATIRFLSVEPLIEDLGDLDLTGIDWVIIGGESGFNARPCDMDWIRSVRDQCRQQDVACFVKQVGAMPIITESGYRLPAWIGANLQMDRHMEFIHVKLRDSHGGDWSEWPEDVRVRELPKVRASV